MEPLIRQKADWQTATNAEIRAFFQEATSHPIATKYTYGDAIDRVTANLIAEGVEASTASTRAAAMVKRLATALNANSAGDVEANILFRQFATAPGIALHTSERQSMLATFATAASWPNGTLAKLQALGVRTSTRWADTYGASEPAPTLQQIGDVVTNMKFVLKCEQAIAILSTPNRNGKTFAALKQEVGAL